MAIENVAEGKIDNTYSLYRMVPPGNTNTNTNDTTNNNTNNNTNDNTNTNHNTDDNTNKVTTFIYFQCKMGHCSSTRCSLMSQSRT